MNNKIQLIPGETYKLIDQTFITPIDDGLHPMNIKVQSLGSSGMHFREIEAYGYVENGLLLHIELPNGDVVHWWSWDRDREEKRQKLRDVR